MDGSGYEFLHKSELYPGGRFLNLLVVLKIYTCFSVLSDIDFSPSLRYCMSLERRNIMTEQELLDMFIQERLIILLAKLH